MRRRSGFLVPAGIALALLLCAAVARAEVPKVLVEELVLYNAEEVQPLALGLKHALASRLAGQGYEVVTAPAARSASVGWTVKPVVTRVGSRYTVDVALESARPETAGSQAYATATGIDGLLPALEEVATKLKAVLAVRPVGAEPDPAASARASPPPPPPPAPAAAAEPPRSRELFARPRTGPSLPGDAKSVVATDFDADGRAEILVLVGSEVVALRDDGRELKILWRSPVPRSVAPALLSAGDIDNDGVPEVFLAGLQANRPVTQAYRWSASGLVEDGKPFEGFARAVFHPERGALLLGMLPGVRKELFAEGLHLFRLVEGRYRPTGNFPSPPAFQGLNIDWWRFDYQRPPFTVVTTRAERLRVYDPEGKILFEDSEKVKGTENVIVGEEKIRDYFDEDTYRVEGKTVFYDTGPANTLMILARNSEDDLGLTRRTRSLAYGQLVAIGWQDGRFLAHAAGPKERGFLSDLDLWPRSAPGASAGKGAGRTLYAALVEREGVLFKSYASKLLAYDLP